MDPFRGKGRRLGSAVAVLALAGALPAAASPVPAPPTGGGPGAAPAEERPAVRPAEDGMRGPAYGEAVVVSGAAPLRLGTALFPTSTGIPSRALLAYHRASDVLSMRDPSCQVPWSLLAAMAAVETNHGRVDESRIGSDGVARPAITGAPVAAHAPTAGAGDELPADTDSGSLDGEPAGDLPVGPFGLFPSVWQVVAVDGDGDGLRRPQDVDDAALAVGVRLCEESRRLDGHAQAREALAGLGASPRYVAAVLRLESRYRSAALEAEPVGAVEVFATPVARTATATESDRGPGTGPRPEREPPRQSGGGDGGTGSGAVSGSDPGPPSPGQAADQEEAVAAAPAPATSSEAQPTTEPWPQPTLSPPAGASAVPSSVATPGGTTTGADPTGPTTEPTTPGTPSPSEECVPSEEQPEGEEGPEPEGEAGSPAEDDEPEAEAEVDPEPEQAADAAECPPDPCTGEPAEASEVAEPDAGPAAGTDPEEVPEVACAVPESTDPDEQP